MTNYQTVKHVGPYLWPRPSRRLDGMPPEKVAGGVTLPEIFRPRPVFFRPVRGLILASSSIQPLPVYNNSVEIPIA